MNFLEKDVTSFHLVEHFFTSATWNFYENFGTLMTTSLRAGSNKHKAFKDFLT